MFKVTVLLVLLSALFYSNNAFSPIPVTTVPPPPTTIPPSPHPTTTPPPPPPTTTPPWTTYPQPPTSPKPVFKSNYVIIAPSTIRPNMRFRIGVNILKTSVWCHLTAYVKKGAVIIAQGKGKFRKGGQGRIVIQLPKEMVTSYYTLVVKSTGGLYFTRYYSLKFKSKRMSLFIQSNKAIFKPGDKVHFRALGFYSNLQVYKGAFDISILDPNLNKIQHWVNQSSSIGVVVKELQLSSLPVLGDWTIKVKTEKENVEKKFKVARYVLPKFEVIVLMPTYSLVTNKEIRFTVKAKYLFGKPLRGTAVISFKLLSSYQNYDTPHIKPFAQMTVDVDGEADVAIGMDKLMAVSKYLNGRKLAVMAIVTEDLTGNFQNSTGDVKIFSKGVKLEFLSMNPKTFKPGMDYFAYLKVSQPDGAPLKLSDKKVIISTRFTVEHNQLPEYHHGEYFWLPPTTSSKYAKDVEYTVPENGLVVLHVPVIAEATAVFLTAKYDGISAYLSLEKSHSPSNSYIQVMLLTKMSINAGDEIEFELKSTRPMETLQYQILARGELIYSGSFMGNGKTIMTVTVRAIYQMAPSARIVIYYVRSDGEIVTDSISFDVYGAFRNKVDLKLSDNVVAPGGDISVHVRADPGSHAFLLAIDQSVLQLASGNDITSDEVYDELNHYDYSFQGQVYPRPMFFRGGDIIRRLPYPVYYGGSDASKIFQNAGVIVLTDAWVYRYSPPRYIDHYTTSMPMGTTMMMLEAQAMRMDAPQVKDNIQEKSTAGGLKETEIRTNFPETWLWTEVRTCVNGEATVITSVPDTITSWVASGFAVNGYSGFGMPDLPSNLRVFKPFFISLNLPYSIVLGEEVAIQIIIFNYLATDQFVKVTLESAVTFTSVYVDCNGVEYRLQKDQVFSIWVKAGMTRSVFFPIIALVIGHINIQVRAQTTSAADGVRRQMLVEAPGVPFDYNIPVLIDLTSKILTFKKTIQISLPPNTVPGSELVKITAVGDLMGPSITGLEKLLRIPTGCGEQTMLSLAPDVAITEYLKITNQLSMKIKDKALSFMEKGYQNELRYRHADGSYSAFLRDKSGSMWLTAFVARVFHQASGHIYVDIENIRLAVRWIVARQNNDGSFPEPGRVIHKNMQGQAGSGVSLSAFVFIALLENENVFEKTDHWWTKLHSAKVKCLAYLEAEVAISEDLYLMTLAVYAFQLAGSSQTDALLERLIQKAVTSDGLIHWHQEDMKKAKVGSWHRPVSSSAIDVEMTSHVLLVYALKKDLVGGKKIMQWVAQQRNSQGGYSSTQDTVVALYALSSFAELVYSDNFDIKAHVILDQGETYTFTINHDNALISQRRETKNLPSEITIEAQGRGLALVEISVFFNVEVEVEDTTFDLTINLLNQTKNHFVLNICTSWLGEGSASGMAVAEIGVPSGFAIDTDSITEMPILRKIETENKKVILYFDEISTKSLCLYMRVDRTGLVARVKSAAIKVYDYYEPSNQITAFYRPGTVVSSKICAICPECRNCNIKPEGLPSEVEPSPIPVDEEKLIEMGMNGTD